MLVELHLPTEAVITTVITCGTTVVVTAIRVGGRVAIAWIESRSHHDPSPPADRGQPQAEGQPDLSPGALGDPRDPGAARA
jgi:hypothetical protein